MSEHEKSKGLPYTTPDRLVQDFVSRGLVLLPPESLGVSPDIHGRIFAEQKRVHDAGKGVIAPALIPEVLEVLKAPGLVAACNQLVGENWAIVPCTHCGSFARVGASQHWHKDDNGPYNGRKQRHHHAVQIEVLYFPKEVKEDTGPTATMPYSHYWAFNHEENHDNFAGADHLDFDFHITGMDAVDISGPKSPYSVDDIVGQRTPQDIRMREAVTNTEWPLVHTFEAAPLRAGSVIIYSHNLFHRGNHRRDDWRTWGDNPRFMWRFWLYRTTDPAIRDTDLPAEISWAEIDPLTGVDLTAANNDATSVWRYHHHWMQTGAGPAPRPETAALAPNQMIIEAERLREQLLTMGEEAEPTRIGAAYQLAALGDPDLAVRTLTEALYTERESARRAATYGLAALGREATSALVEAVGSPVKWVRKAGVFGLGEASQLDDEVLDAVVGRLCEDPSVYVRAVAAGSLGCLGRRAIATGVGKSLVPDCLHALVECLGREQNRLSMDRAQGRSIKFVRPTDECDVCEGNGIDFGIERFEPVRSAVRENALWSMVILCSHGEAVLGGALELVIEALTRVIGEDENAVSVGFAMDALSRLAQPAPEEEAALPAIGDLRANLKVILQQSPIRSWESLVRAGLEPGDGI